MTGDHDGAEEADRLYRPLGGLGPWEAVEVDGASWDGVRAALRRLDEKGAERAGLLRRGALLAAAYQSGALSGRHDGSLAAVAGLLRSGSMAALRARGHASGAIPHVVANHAALVSAADAEPGALASEPFIRNTHALACAPQTHHQVPGGHGTDDHVLGHGDYKHHANHRPTGDGGWRAHAPVPAVVTEMARLVAGLAGGDGGGLHPVTRAAFALHGLHHVAPFPAGNGRVGRALSGGILLRAGGVPPLFPAGDRDQYGPALEAAATGRPAALVDLLLRSCALLAGHLDEEQPDLAAEERWRRQSVAAGAVAALLPSRLAAAIDRHGRRRAAGWEADLSGAEVDVPGPATVVMRCSAGGTAPVEEILRVDPHPVRVEGDGPLLVAEQAGLHLEIPDQDAGGSFGEHLDRWLDLAVAALAIRAAAEAE
ncbi:MAG: Fic family protein [Acidimicrobiales bacterium]